ncbi:MAG: hypothetical protein JWM53_3021 [bacterium]|nr:hypothetical protein [bacterium]
MPIPHSNYNPPPNTVDVADKHGRIDPSWSWDGTSFRHKGHVHKPHHNTTITGKSGTAMDGWIYDWHHHTWLEPDHQIAQVPMGGAGVVPPAAQQPQIAVVHPHREEYMHNGCAPHAHQNSLLDGLKNHPWVPLLGLAVLVASDFMTQPAPPQIPDTLPEVQQKFWMMTYNQNVALYQDRKQKLDKWGNIIFSLGASNAAVQAGGATTLQQHLGQMGAPRAAM